MDVNEWKKNHFGDLQDNLQNTDALSKLILETLNNFAYRYFEIPAMATTESKSKFSVKGTGPNAEYGLLIEIKGTNQYLIQATKNDHAKEVPFGCDDLVDFRNKFAKYLEEGCDIF